MEGKLQAMWLRARSRRSARCLAAAGLALILGAFGPSRPAPAQNAMGGRPVNRAGLHGPVAVDFKALAAAHAAAGAPAEAPTPVPPFMPIPGNLPIPDAARRSAAAAVPADAAAAPAPTPSPPSASFEALPGNHTRIPPDTMGAAGPNHLMTMLNTEIRIHDKIGGIVSTASLSSFWDVFPDTPVDPFDPRVIFDCCSQRWFAHASANARAADSALVFACSMTDDPTGGWWLWLQDADPTDMVWWDFGMMATNPAMDAIIISGNLFSVADDSFVRGDIWIIEQSKACAGIRPLCISRLSGQGGGIFPAQSLDCNQSTEFLVQTWDTNPPPPNAGQAFYRLYSITGSVCSPTINNAGSTDGVFLSDTFTSDSAAPLINTGFATQLGTTARIANNDPRISSSPKMVGGRLWFANHLIRPAGSPDRTTAHWMEVDPFTATVVQSGQIGDTAGEFRYFPSIAADALGNAVIGYTRSSSQEFASAVYACRTAGAAPGTFSPEELLKAGEAPYNKPGGSPPSNRWGDYSETSLDCDGCFWTIQEYAKAPHPNRASRWSTWWGKICKEGEPCDPPPTPGNPNPADAAPDIPVNSVLTWNNSPLKAQGSDPVVYAGNDAAGPGWGLILDKPLPPDQAATLRVPVRMGKQFRDEDAARLPLTASVETALSNVTINVQYQDAAGEGFFDPVLGAARRAAFEFALGLLGGFVGGMGSVEVSTQMDPLSSGVIGGASPWSWHQVPGLPVPNTWYPAALTEALTGTDPNGADPEIFTVFSSNFDFYLGTDANPPGALIDLVTVVIHEVCHGLGFADSFESNGSFGLGPPFGPVIYDTFLVNGAGQQIISLRPKKRNVIGNNLFWSGANAVQAFQNDFGGTGNVPLYAPTPFAPGSSIAHLDQSTFEGTPFGLMMPFYVAANHDPQSITLGIKTDIGWPAAQGSDSCPTTYDVFLDTVNPPTTLVCSNVAVPICDPSGLAPDTTYFWRVEAHNCCSSTTGPVWSFTTEPPPCLPIATPASPDPADNAAAVALNPVLTWSSTTGSVPSTSVAPVQNAPQVEYAATGRSGGATTKTYPAYGIEPQVPAGLIVNGDFETGTLAGWTVVDVGLGAWVINDGALDPDGPDGPVPPCGELFSTVTDQTGAGVHTLYQDVTIPAGFTTATLHWTDRIRNHATGDFREPDQEFRVQVRDPNTGAVLATLFSTDPGDPDLQPCTARTGDLTPFIGQPIRIAFEEEDNLNFFNVHLDDVFIDIDCPTAYDVFFGSTNPPADLVCQNLTTLSCTPPGPLAPDTTYFWQVVAWNCCAATDGPVWRFTTGAPICMVDASRDPEAAGPGDLDQDGDVDLSDYLAFLACFSGAGEPVPDACCPGDFDEDLDVDLSDLIAFQSRFTGTR